MSDREIGLEIEHVSKDLGGRTIVDDMQLEVRAGELTCLLGPSGCGKTTTLRMIGGFLIPDRGRVLISGTDVTSLSPDKRPTAMVFQNYALWPHMTVFKNVAFGLRLRKLPRQEVSDRVAQVLELVGLTHHVHSYPARISGGEQQRVALARALVLEPKVLLLDEPLSNLDAKLRRRVREEIRELQRELNLTVAYVTHDQEEALAVSDQVIVMDRGVIAQQGSPAELYDSPRSRFLADFIGDANLVTGELIHDASGQVFRANDVSVPVRAGGVPAGPATLAVRPHRLILTPAGAGLLPAECRRAAYLGSRVEYVLGTPWGDLLVFDAGVNSPLARGECAGIEFRPEDAIVLAGHA